MKRTFLYTIIITAFLVASGLMAQSIRDMENEADEYYKKKEFNKAVALWLNILNLEPESERIQKKIELVYEEKQKKDLSIQRARLNFKIAKKTLDINQNIENLSDEQIRQNIVIIRQKADIAIASFIAAYRIDPSDADLQVLKDSMKSLEKDVRAEEEKGKLSLEMRRKMIYLRQLADTQMNAKEYETALKTWNEILVIIPLDRQAQEGKRACQLAIENRLNYEKIHAFMEKGIALMGVKKYRDARVEFMQVLAMDEKNREAERYIERIDEKLEEERLMEATRIQAEEFYISGINNLKTNRFRLAEEDFQNVLALLPDYKDTKERLRNLKRLEEEFIRRRREEDLRKINKEFQDGMIALQEGRFREAIASFEITLTIDPTNDRAREFMNRAKESLKAESEEIVDVNSPYFDIINSLTITGKQLYEQKKYEESRKKWDSILSLFPKNKVASEYLLRCELMLNPGAYDRFTAQVRDEGNDFLAKKDYRNALKRFELLKSIDAKYPGIDALMAQARNSMKKGRTDLTEVDRAEIERRYRVGVDYYGRGGKDNYEKALTEFRWVVAKDPDHVKAIISLNKIEAALRLNTQTVEAQKRTLTPEQQQLVRKHYYTGINYYSGNDFKKAIEEWRKVLAIDPDNVKAKNNIRKCLVFLGRTQ